MQLDRDKTAARDKCGPAGITLWDESTAGVNDHTLNTSILQELVALLFPGSASTAHTATSFRLCIGHTVTCALLLAMIYVTGTKVLAHPRQSCVIYPTPLCPE